MRAEKRSELKAKRAFARGWGLLNKQTDDDELPPRERPLRPSAVNKYTPPRSKGGGAPCQLTGDEDDFPPPSLSSTRFIKIDKSRDDACLSSATY